MTDYMKKLDLYDAYKARQKALFARERALYVSGVTLLKNEPPIKSQNYDKDNLKLEQEMSDLQYRLDDAHCLVAQKDQQLRNMAKDHSRTLHFISSATDNHNAHMSQKIEKLSRDLLAAQELLANAESQIEENGAKASMDIESLKKRLLDFDCNNWILIRSQSRLLEMEATLMDFAQCKICYEFNSDPSVLACGHIFCSYCTQSWKRVNHPIGSKLSCPVCRHEGKVFRGSTRVISRMFGLVEHKYPVVNPILIGEEIVSHTDEGSIQNEDMEMSSTIEDREGIPVEDA